MQTYSQQWHQASNCYLRGIDFEVARQLLCCLTMPVTSLKICIKYKELGSWKSWFMHAQRLPKGWQPHPPRIAGLCPGFNLALAGLLRSGPAIALSSSTRTHRSPAALNTVTLWQWQEKSPHCWHHAQTVTNKFPHSSRLTYKNLSLDKLKQVLTLTGLGQLASVENLPHNVYL